ncbi:TonB-dependent receptor domain-containing protein [Mucilaginibacter antarcticus]|uniref:TonB-dependent receptor domain-containing protein n=1 Tax=Mucilaginibacter antarcticus TaxID=1855725 RepID=A0ABW5XMY2_9SPHI
MRHPKLLTTLLLSAFSQLLFAQNGIVKGSITDQQTKQPVDYATISLLKTNDSAAVSGVVTKANGTYVITGVQPGSYLLKASFLGYRTGYSPAFEISNTKTAQVINVALIASQQLLNQVAVTGQQIKSLYKIDKQSYKAGQFESAKGGSAIDVLKNLPSVSVNGEGDISVRGSSGFLVLLNGKPVLTDAQTVLGQLPANAIDNIELVTAPSAKYDPDGRGGIINIITKKGANDGFTVAANAQGGLPATIDYGNARKPLRFGGDLTLNYKKDKWDISVGGNYNRNDNAGYREGDAFTTNAAAGTITRFPSVGERSFKKYNYAGRATINYTADANNSFSAGLFAGSRYQDRIADILYHNTTSNLATGALLKSNTYFNANTQTKQGNFTLANLDYTHTFQNKSTLTAGLLYEHADLYGNTKNRNLKYPNTADTIQYVYNPYKRPINGYRFKLDHSINLGKGKLESGYQLRYDTQEGQFDYLVTPPTAQPDIAKFSGSLRARNTINSVYSQYSGKASKLEYNAGLRYEYASRKVNISYDADPHLLNLSNLFPSASLLYSIKDTWKLKAGYSKRINRNSDLQLNPIPEREHSETYEVGDPDLLPEFIDLAELGINHTFSKGSFFATAYYQHIKNPIQRLNSFYADTILNRVFTNAGNARLWGMEAGASLQPLKWWSLYLGANVYNYHIYGDIKILNDAVTVNNQNWAYSINGNSTFQLNKTLSLQANVNYLSKRPTAQGEDSHFFVPNASVKKTLANGRWAVSAQWQNINIFNANKQRITTAGANFYTTTNYIYETNVFLINVTFNLNKFTSKLKLLNSEMSEKEF